jgi:hypothetical protein
MTDDQQAGARPVDPAGRPAGDDSDPGPSRLDALARLWLVTPRGSRRDPGKTMAVTAQTLWERIDLIRDGLGELDAGLQELRLSWWGERPDGFEAWVAQVAADYHLSEATVAAVLADDGQPESNPALRNEWMALFESWAHAFGPKAGPSDKVYWHDALARVLGRCGEPDDHKTRARNRRTFGGAPGGAPRRTGVSPVGDTSPAPGDIGPGEGGNQ